ncbi:MAG: 50S ribosomal protein L16 [Verrucomicrobia bacterium GWC2_42_7]|nr:MAG: 50S ribosomal protein L16 [Verrucomicrobia bacterium GWC2_42_7]
MANLLPAKTKYRKVHKGRVYGQASSCNKLAFGDFAIQALDRAWLTSSQLEAARVAITRHLKRRGKVWMRVFPHKPVTKKPAEVRMGQGKGPVEYYVAVVKPGTVIFEIAGVAPSLAREAMRLADFKLPFRSRFISREEQEQY